MLRDGAAGDDRLPTPSRRRPQAGGVADAGRLRWLDPPPAASLAQARGLLHELEAIDGAGRVTPHGRALASMGAHPRLAHMLIKGRDLKAQRLACDLAAILSEEAFDDLDGPIMRVTGPDVPAIPFSPNLDKAWQVNTEKIVAGIEKLAAY